jgi:hypothetical protein
MTNGPRGKPSGKVEKVFDASMDQNDEGHPVSHSTENLSVRRRGALRATMARDSRIRQHILSCLS